MKKTITLKKNYEFKNVLDKGKAYFGKYICIYVLNNYKKNKIGIAVGKKTGNAVVRNRIKRLIRESYLRQESNIKENYSIVFLFKKSNNNKLPSFFEINEDIEILIKKAELIKNE